MSTDNTDTLPDAGSAENSGKAAGRPWSKGVSGNPGGRRRKTAEARAVEKLARASSGEALDTVLSIMRGGDGDRVRLAAALAVIERGIGKPGDMLPEPVQVPDGATLVQRAEAIVGAAMAGAVSVSQASALLSCLASVATVQQADDLARRIADMEVDEEGVP
jgi:hypothetical protein